MLWSAKTRSKPYLFINWYLLSSTFFSAPFLAALVPLQPSPKCPLGHNLLRRSCLFILSTSHVDYVSLCKSLLASALLSRFSGIVVCRLTFFALCLETTYEWVHVIIVFLCLGYLTQNNVFYLHPFSCKIQAVVFFLLCSIPLCKCTTFPYPFFSRGAKPQNKPQNKPQKPQNKHTTQ